MTTEGDRSRAEALVAAELVARLARGEAAAVAELDRRYRRGLVFLILRRSGDRALAEDVCQETFLTAMEKLCPPVNGHAVAGIDRPERLGAFLRGIALNKLTGIRRKETRQATTVDSEAVERAVDERQPIDDVATDQMRDAVKEILNDLPTSRDRDILVSVYLRDENRESICQRLRLDAAHFNRVLSRAKKRFRDAVERADGDLRRRRPFEWSSS